MDTRSLYESIKAKCERARTARDRAEWRGQELQRELKEEFGCDNAEEALKLLEELKEKATELDRRAVLMYKAIIETHEELR